MLQRRTVRVGIRIESIGIIFLCFICAAAAQETAKRISSPVQVGPVDAFQHTRDLADEKDHEFGKAKEAVDLALPNFDSCDSRIGKMIDNLIVISAKRQDAYENWLNSWIQLSKADAKTQQRFYKEYGPSREAKTKELEQEEEALKLYKQRRANLLQNNPIAISEELDPAIKNMDTMIKLSEEHIDELTKRVEVLKSLEEQVKRLISNFEDKQQIIEKSKKVINENALRWNDYYELKLAQTVTKCREKWRIKEPPVLNLIK